MSEKRNIIIAIVLSMLVVVGYEFFYGIPKQREAELAASRALAEQQIQGKPTESNAVQSSQTSPAPPVSQPQAGMPPQPNLNEQKTTTETKSESKSVDDAKKDAKKTVTRDQALAQSQRVRVQTPRVNGSISLQGGGLDDVTLPQYKQEIDAKSPSVILLSPRNAENAYFTNSGWVSSNAKIEVPNENTIWTSDSNELVPGKIVTLSWQNRSGQKFFRQFSIDANYMVTITDRVENRGTDAVTFFPYSLATRSGNPPAAPFFILHEGFVGVLQDKLKEYSYSDAKIQQPVEETATGGWFGLTDKYFLVSLIPDQKESVKVGFRHFENSGVTQYQIDWIGTARTAAVGETVSSTARIFVGAKEVKTLKAYEHGLGIPKFDYAVDWGWFWFLTRLFFIGVDFFFGLVGNFGVAILLITLLIKGLFYPIANKSYVMQSKMKILTPKIMELRTKYGSDKMRMNQEMMALYKKEKVNPVSGCLPILIQIPVFFALYKVLFVTIEMRHAPFLWWIQDLSAPDPTNIFNLFGLLPWNVPLEIPLYFFSIPLQLGIWPIIMGVTMYFQQKMNPTPPDPIQAKLFQWMPVVMTFFLSGFPSGLVIYWSWNNILSIAQQGLIQHRLQKKHDSEAS